MAARGFVGSGDLYIERLVGGVSQGMLGPYEAGKFEIKPNVDKQEMVSKGRTTRGQVIESVAVQKPAAFTVELREVNKESMTIALLGTGAARTQASGSLVDELLTAKLDTWMPLSKQALSGAVTVKDSAGSTTYVAGTDYLVNPQLGWIKPLSSGAIADAASLKVSGAYAAIAGTLIAGGTNTDIRARLVLDGINAVDGLPCIVTVHEAIIAADAAFDFLSDGFASVPLPGTMKTPTGKTEPFTVELRNA